MGKIVADAKNNVASHLAVKFKDARMDVFFACGLEVEL